MLYLYIKVGDIIGQKAIQVPQTKSSFILLFQGENICHQNIILLRLNLCDDRQKNDKKNSTVKESNFNVSRLTCTLLFNDFLRKPYWRGEKWCIWSFHWLSWKMSDDTRLLCAIQKWDSLAVKKDTIAVSGQKWQLEGNNKLSIALKIRGFC